MRLYINSIAVWVMALATIMFMGCEDKDSDQAFGYSQIYIPQSTVSGGQNLHYLVPTGFDMNTFNYKVDVAADVCHVLLGVSRSGLASNEAYSVELEVRNDTILTLIENGGINLTASNKPVELLPSSIYALPERVSVPQGKSAASFNLSINLTALKSYMGEKVALCVALKNPTRYELNPINDKVILLIDVDALILE